MDTPVCLSQYFVNKQNVRSFSNIIKWSLLKDHSLIPFLWNIFENKTCELVSVVPPELQEVLSCLKTNLLQKGNDDFRNYFSSIEKLKELRPVNKKEVLKCCETALYEIIPRKLFGGNHNSKIFKKILITVLFSMNRQHFQMTKMIKKWNFLAHPWSLMEEDLAKTVLCEILIWIIKNILSAMICLNFYVTSCKLDCDENKLHFFWKSQWQSFYDKQIANMIFTKVLRRFDPYCLGKKTKKRRTFNERLKLKTIKKGIPKLHLVLKVNSGCRPIVRCKNDMTSVEKYRMKERLNFLKILTGKAQIKIESQFNAIFQQWLNLGKPKLYFIKTDLSNAFGSINREKLIKILAERHMNYQKTEKSMYAKQKVAKQYKEMVAELRKPLLVRAGNTVYEWREGLVQGYKYSPALSELYYTYLDEQYLSNHLKIEDTKIKFFTRAVDDYIYITDSLEDAHLFLDALTSYRNVNYEKTVVNFEHKSIRFSDQITFLGYSYNTNTLQVSRACNVFVGQMCFKIAFSSALENLEKFLYNRIGQSGIQINSHIFNLIYNTEELVWRHVFTSFCLSANKFCTILAVLLEPEEMKKYLILYKKRVTVKLTIAMVDTIVKNKPADVFFLYCINHFRFLSFKALYLCAKQTPKCSGLVPLINDELSRTNCLFGKWREHACRIEPNGEIRRKAVKQICRRTDLRVIFKNFENLPEGFECFHHKIMK